MTEKRQTEIFEEWIERYQSLIFKAVRAYAFSPHDHDDLFQEIAIQLWRSVPNFRGDSADSTWIYRVALNTAVKWSRTERKHNEKRSSFDSVKHILRRREDTPRDERLDWLYEEIGRLDEVDRSLTLLMLDGFSYREMSEILGISESHVGVKIHRIKKHLITQSENYDRHEI